MKNISVLLFMSIQTIKSYNIVSKFGRLVITWYNRPQFLSLHVITNWLMLLRGITGFLLSLRGIT